MAYFSVSLIFNHQILISLSMNPNELYQISSRCSQNMVFTKEMGRMGGQANKIMLLALAIASAEAYQTNTRGD